MTLSQMAAREPERNFRMMGERMIGVHVRYPFSLVERAGKSKTTYTMTFSILGKVKSRIRRTIYKQLPKFSAVNAMVANQLIVSFTVKAEADGDAYATMLSVLDIVTNAFRSDKRPVIVPDRCPICGKNNCDGFALFGANFTLAHKNCVLAKSDKKAENAKKNKRSGSYLMGLIGAILGAAIGCIPVVLVVLFTNTDYGMLYFLIPLLSYQGYKLLRGKLGNGARVIVILSSFIAFFIMYPVMAYLRDAVGGRVSYDFFEYLTYFMLNVTPIAFLRVAGFGLIFLIIGLATGFKTLGTSTKDVLRDAVVSIESITNLDGSYSAASAEHRYDTPSVELDY